MTFPLADEESPKAEFASSPIEPALQLKNFAPEAILIVGGIASAWFFDSDLGLLTNIVIMSLFALSLSLVLGQAGIASMGHAALYGSGAYAAGLFALRISSDPLLGLLVGGMAGLIVALLTGLVVLRAKGLTQVMLTIAAAQILMELANWARGITGGDDGLTGFVPAPLFGLFDFDFVGKTGYAYGLAVLVIVFAGLRALMRTPFGLTTQAIRLDPGRVNSLGGHVYAHLLVIYGLGGFVAGLAGALTAQTTKVASLSMLDFHLSASVLIMVVLGGTSRLGGAILGTMAYMGIHHFASGLSPHHWLLVIGILLVATMVVLPGGLMQAWHLRADRRSKTGQGRAVVAKAKP